REPQPHAHRRAEAPGRKHQLAGLLVRALHRRQHERGAARRARGTRNVHEQRPMKNSICQEATTSRRLPFRGWSSCFRVFMAATALSQAALSQAPPSAPPSKPPAAAVKPGTDTYHGVGVADPYRWLERWDDPDVRAWTDAQNDYTRGYREALAFRPQVRARVQALGADTHPRWFAVEYRHGRLFAIKHQPPHEQSVLVVLPSADDAASEKTIVDPVALDPSGKTAIDFYAPSLDGSRVAVSLSQGGTERGDVRVFDVATGRALPDVIPRVNGGTAGGSVAWNADGSGFYYTRYTRPGERPEADLDFYQQLYFHTLGASTDTDTYEIGKDSPKIAETIARSSDDGRFVLVTVNNGDGGERAYFVRPSNGTWIRLAGYTDEVDGAAWGRDN